MSFLERKLEKAFEKYIYISQIGLSPKEFAKKVSEIVLADIVAAAVFIFLLVALRLKIISVPAPPELVFSVITYAAFIIALVSVLTIMDPVLKTYEHLSMCKEELPYVSALLTVYAAAGVPPHKALERIGEKKELFPGFSRLVRRIKKIKKLYILDDLEAIESEARIIPSLEVSDILFSAAGAERGGGDIYAVFRDKMKSAFSFLRESYKALADKMKFVADLILTLYGVLPLTLYIMLAMFARGDVVAQANMYTYVVNPLIFIAMVLIVDGMYPKSPDKYTKYYKYYAKFFLPLAIGLFVVLYMFFGVIAERYLYWIKTSMTMYQIPICLGIAVAASFIPVAVKFTLEYRRLSAIDFALPSFCRDLTEEIKKGYTPSQSIETLAKERSYNKHFDKILTDISRGLKGGLTFREALERVFSKVSWRTRLVFDLIIEADELGSRPEIFEEITNVTREIMDSIKVARESTRSLKFFGLITAGLIVAVICILVLQVLIPIAKTSSMITFESSGFYSFNVGVRFITEKELPGLVSTLLTGTIINALTLGLLTGKMSEGTLASGFRYSIITLVISVIAILYLLGGIKI